MIEKITDKVREICLRRVDYEARIYKLDLAIDTELKPMLLALQKPCEVKG